MEAQKVLHTLRLPARLTVEQTAVLLAFHPDSINFLVDVHMLETLGEADGVQRMFFANYINALRSDAKWLTRATNRVREHHRARNSAQKAGRAKKSGNAA